MARPKVRVAILGTGGIARVHAEALKAEASRVDVVAAVDLRAEAASAFAERYDIPRTYQDVEALLTAERPDIVHVCTSPKSHAELSIRCLEAGAWVLCEKPMAASLRELDRIQQAEASSGAYCSSVYQWRFGAGAQHLSGLIKGGRLGRPLVGVCQTTWYRDAAYYAVPWRGTWASELGGCTMGHGIHAIDLFLWLYGPWREVSAMTGTLDHDIEVEDVSLANVRFENEALGAIVNSVVSPRQESRLRFDLQRATVELVHLYDYRNEDWTYTPPEGTEASEGAEESAEESAELASWRALPEETARSLHHAQVRSLLDCFERGERPITSGEGARTTLGFVASMYKSAATGRPVTRGSLLPGDPFYEAMGGGPRGPERDATGRASGRASEPADAGEAGHAAGGGAGSASTRGD